MKSTLIISILLCLCVATSQAKIDTLYLKVDGRVTMQIVESPEVSSIVLKEQSFNTTNKTFSNEEVLTLLSGGVVQKYLENKMVSLFPPQFTEVWEEIHIEDGETVSVTLMEQAQLSWVFLIFGMVFPFLTILFLNIFAKREKRKEILIVLVFLIVLVSFMVAAAGLVDVLTGLASAVALTLAFSSFVASSPVASLAVSIAIAVASAFVGDFKIHYIGLTVVCCLVSYEARLIYRAKKLATW